MKSLPILLLGLLALFTLPAAYAESLADYSADMQIKTPKKGWQYQWNSGAIEESSKYTALIWNDSAGGYTIAAKYPDEEGTGYLRLGGPFDHPGRIRNDGTPTFAIASYALQTGQGGRIKITHGNIKRIDDQNAGSLHVEILVNGKMVKDFITSSTSDFANDLGTLNDGDVISVAVGPDHSDTYDGFKMTYSIERS